MGAQVIATSREFIKGNLGNQPCIKHYVELSVQCRTLPRNKHFTSKCKENLGYYHTKAHHCATTMSITSWHCAGIFNIILLPGTVGFFVCGGCCCLFLFSQMYTRRMCFLELCILRFCVIIWRVRIRPCHLHNKLFFFLLFFSLFCMTPGLI